MDEDRGTGATTRQMRAAPHGALFVWVNNNLSYPRNLASALGRTDLRIVSPEGLQPSLYGHRFPTVVIDHAARLNSRQREIVQALLVYASETRIP